MMSTTECLRRKIRIENRYRSDPDFTPGIWIGTSACYPGYGIGTVQKKWEFESFLDETHLSIRRQGDVLRRSKGESIDSPLVVGVYPLAVG